MLGRMASLPASPPSPPAVCNAAGMLAPFENFVDGLINEPAIAKCLPEPSRAIPAGFHQTVVASSATAAAPAYAFPNPLTPCSYRAKAAACASEPASRPSADTTAPAIALRFIFFSPLKRGRLPSRPRSHTLTIFWFLPALQTPRREIAAVHKSLPN